MGPVCCSNTAVHSVSLGPPVITNAKHGQLLTHPAQWRNALAYQLLNYNIEHVVALHASAQCGNNTGLLCMAVLSVFIRPGH